MLPRRDQTCRPPSQVLLIVPVLDRHIASLVFDEDRVRFNLVPGTLAHVFHGVPGSCRVLLNAPKVQYLTLRFAIILLLR